MRTYDLSPLYRSTVGYDHFADLLDRALTKDTTQNTYPPFNIVKSSDEEYRISIAAAGFSTDELDIEVKENSLVVSARKKADEDGAVYLHKGIAQRSFDKKFQLADHVKVTGASYVDGMLNIDLKREIPEAYKPRKISIANGSAPNGKAKDQVTIDA
ncbi:MAG: Hsp20 family protein [Rhodobacteraceae bacterium]|nr:Hsp20 family protein [Paracoccaceae bacterium]